MQFVTKQKVFQCARDIKLREYFHPILFYLPSKFTEDWIYGVRVMSYLKSYPHESAFWGNNCLYKLEKQKLDTIWRGNQESSSVSWDL